MQVPHFIQAENLCDAIAIAVAWANCGQGDMIVMRSRILGLCVCHESVYPVSISKNCFMPHALSNRPKMNGCRCEL